MFEAGSDALPVPAPSVSKEQLAEKHRETREKVIAELYSTETDYCACLDLSLRTFFAAPLPPTAAVSAEDMETLFGHVEDVMTLSQRLIDRLKAEAVDQPFDEQIVGECCVAVCSFLHSFCQRSGTKGKGSPYSIAERRVPELIPVLGSQPAGDVSHKPGGRLPLLVSAALPCIDVIYSVMPSVL